MWTALCTSGVWALSTTAVAARDSPTTPEEAEPTPPRHRYGDEGPANGNVAFLIGVGRFELSDLQQRLATHGYEELSTTATLIGGEAYGVSDSGFVIGARGAAILYPDGDGPGNYRTSFGGGFGMVDLGFALLCSRRVLLTLVAGIGAYAWSLDISDRASANFDVVLGDPARNSSMGQGGLLTGLTLGFDGGVPVGRVKRGQQGFFTLGAQLSVLYGPPSGSVTFDDDADVHNAPDMNLVGVYGALTIGFGERRQ